MKLDSLEDMLAFGQKIATRLQGGEVLELVGDVGAGKTTFTKGLALGLGVQGTVQSPTFTISREYETSSLIRLVHYDFYRLQEAGIMADELFETLNDPHNVVVIEWSDSVAEVLPEDRLTIAISLVAGDETAREVSMHAGGVASTRLLGEKA